MIALDAIYTTDKVIATPPGCHEKLQLVLKKYNFKTKTFPKKNFITFEIEKQTLCKR